MEALIAEELNPVASSETATSTTEKQHSKKVVKFAASPAKGLSTSE